MKQQQVATSHECFNRSTTGCADVGVPAAESSTDSVDRIVGEAWGRNAKATDSAVLRLSA
jgi:hypothetical protein